ncbi:hypothetical protein BPA30113_06852 [Burkholderia paludis]|uniref:Uncharacterized protein n=1 Tax=Burkholderia paludis TaxID=1506587 RepID=A0A6J5F0V0_9BURK|nr:hypothetical protein LMG30113_06331 [Burkholderia paludis]VWC40183.1 hypothetical protein BPA30113_06852 [Burkholderia paludis]
MSVPEPAGSGAAVDLPGPPGREPVRFSTFCWRLLQAKALVMPAMWPGSVRNPMSRHARS